MSVGKPSAMSFKLLPFRSLESTMVYRQRGQLASGCDFNHVTRQWRHKRWPQGRSLGRVKCSWHTVHSMWLGSFHATAVVIVTSCVGLWQAETHRQDSTWHNTVRGSTKTMIYSRYNNNEIDMMMPKIVFSTRITSTTILFNSAIPLNDQSDDTSHNLKLM